VLPHEDPDHRFFETVATNLGYEISYFTELDEAEKWLSEGPSPSGEGKGRPQQMAR
jgi:hypothetical protein